MLPMVAIGICRRCSRRRMLTEYRRCDRCTAEDIAAFVTDPKRVRVQEVAEWEDAHPWLGYVLQRIPAFLGGTKGRRA